MSGKIKNSYLLLIAVFGAVFPVVSHAGTTQATPPPTAPATPVTAPGASAPAPKTPVTTPVASAPAPATPTTPVSSSTTASPPPAPANPHALFELQSWSDVQKLLVPETSGDRSVPVGMVLEQNTTTFAYGAARIRGQIFASIPYCEDSQGHPIASVPDVSKDLSIEPIDPPVSTIDSKGKTIVNQGFTVAASHELMACMEYMKRKHKACSTDPSDPRYCVSASKLGGTLANVQEGNDQALSFCYQNGREADDMSCKVAKILTPARTLLTNYQKEQKEKKVKADNKKAEDLDNEVTACEKSLDNGNLDAFFEANKLIMAEGKFLEKNKKGNTDLKKKAEDFDVDTLQADNFKKAIEQLKAAADKWVPKTKGHSDEGDQNLTALRKMVHEVINAKLDNDSDKTASRAYAEDILSVYDHISANYRERALKSNDAATIKDLLAEASKTYEDAKKEKIFNADQKARIDEQIALLGGLVGKLKDELVWSQRNLPGHAGNPSGDLDLMKQFAKEASDSCPANLMSGGLPSALLVQMAQTNNSDIKAECASAVGYFAAAQLALVASCQNTISQARSTGFPSAAAYQCQQYAQPQVGLIPQQALMAGAVGGNNVLGGAIGQGAIGGGGANNMNQLMVNNIMGRNLAGGNIFGLNGGLAAQPGIVTNPFNTAACLSSQTGTGCW